MRGKISDSIYNYFYYLIIQEFIYKRIRFLQGPLHQSETPFCSIQDTVYDRGETHFKQKLTPQFRLLSNIPAASAHRITENFCGVRHFSTFIFANVTPAASNGRIWYEANAFIFICAGTTVITMELHPKTHHVASVKFSRWPARPCKHDSACRSWLRWEMHFSCTSVAHIRGVMRAGSI